jgi:anti-sigma regulatory factor (Ser/Thr protein kinase)
VSSASTIRLTVPGELRFRDVAVRAVAAACRLVGADRAATGAPTDHALDLSDHWDAEVVSAFSEIFNNIAIHAYGAGAAGDIAIEMTPARDHLAIVVSDHGAAFDLSQIPSPELESLPEGGMGIHIARACVDELHYTAGPPNTWRLTKYHAEAGAHPHARRPRPTTSQG